MRRVTRAISTFAAATAVLLAAGCGTSADPDQAADGDGQVRLYGSDGNMSSSLGDALKDQPGVLTGMKGTTPLTPLTEDFKKRIRTVDPSLADFNYAGESYDAVVTAALAAEMARSTDAPVIAKYVVGVTVDGTECNSFKDCAALVRQGENIQYRGVSSLKRSGLTDAGEPSTATYGALNFGRDNHIDDNKTEFVGAGDESTAGKNQPAPPAGSGNTGSGNNGTKPKAAPLKVGALLPRTGALTTQGPPMFAGARLAVNEINEAGGVLGQPVEWAEADDGTGPQTAAVGADRLIAAGVQVIIGPASSSATEAVVPKAVAAGRIVFSPSATSDGLSRLDDKGMFFRTSPPDVLQAKALADIVMRDGAAKVMIIARSDDYGSGLAKAVQADLTSAGVKAGNVRIVSYKDKDKYDNGDQATVFKPLAVSVKQFKPDAVVILGFDETALLIRALHSEQIAFKS
ncbi:ABC transporter substrate-binding protein [Planosporangium sp. 12N6]|uniref:ABC transporter substrate-binding protein n=1 Tax=Planosporangium spinosum TaxID=3402278 RepID=UPI003CED887E